MTDISIQHKSSHVAAVSKQCLSKVKVIDAHNAVVGSNNTNTVEYYFIIKCKYLIVCSINSEHVLCRCSYNLHNLLVYFICNC